MNLLNTSLEVINKYAFIIILFILLIILFLLIFKIKKKKEDNKYLIEKKVNWLDDLNNISNDLLKLLHFELDNLSDNNKIIDITYKLRLKLDLNSNDYYEIQVINLLNKILDNQFLDKYTLNSLEICINQFLKQEKDKLIAENSSNKENALRKIYNVKKQNLQPKLHKKIETYKLLIERKNSIINENNNLINTQGYEIKENSKKIKKYEKKMLLLLKDIKKQKEQIKDLNNYINEQNNMIKEYKENFKTQDLYITEKVGRIVELEECIDNSKE